MKEDTGSLDYSPHDLMDLGCSFGTRLGTVLNYKKDHYVHS